MKKIVKIAVFLLLFVIGITKVDAAAFKIGGTPYDSLNEAVLAAPSDGTETLIEMTEDVTLAPGVQVTEGKNLIIDFGGHRFETWEPMVGSKGTETQSFQLLKGSTVTMRNGTLVASTHELSKMFIQNYANLTLENVTIDATTNTYDYFYAVSSNNGVVNIIGNTSILVNTNTHARAFDMCWAPLIGNAAYNGGTQMTVNTTGRINGIIELDVWGSYTDVNGIKSTLTIKNINFDGKWEIDSRLKNQLSIEGGSFASTDTIDLDEYVTGSNIPYLYNNVYDVLPSKTLKINEEEIYVAKGNTYDLDIEIPSGYEKYASITVQDTSVATLENGVLTGKTKGTTTLVISFGRSGASLPITVYEVKSEETEEVSDTASAAVNEIAEELIEQILSDEAVEGVDAETKAKIVEAIQAGKTIVTELEATSIKEEDLDEEVVEKIKEKADGEIVGFLDIDILFKADDVELGNLTKLPEPVEISVEVKDTFGAVPEGKSRKFYVVRIHDGEEPELLEAKYENGKLTFKTDRFSTYAYGYTDTAVTSSNPKTGDNILVYCMMLLISVTGLTAAIMYGKRQAELIKK